MVFVSPDQTLLDVAQCLQAGPHELAGERTADGRTPQTGASQAPDGQAADGQAAAPGPEPGPGELEVLIRARYPLLYVITWEEQRVLADVMRIGSRLGKAVFEWSVNTGLVPTGTSAQSSKHRDTATQDPLVALDNVIGHVDPALYVFKDFHPFLKRENMAVIRRLREVALALKNTYKTIVMTSPLLEIPPELEKDVTIVDFDLPQESHFMGLLGHILEEVKDNPKIKIDLDPKSRETDRPRPVGTDLDGGGERPGQGAGPEQGPQRQEPGGHQPREAADHPKERPAGVL